MQGRVLPDKTDRLQIFPNKWIKELSLIKKVGFDYIELLDDKEGKLRSLLANDPKKLFGAISNAGLSCNSLCADYLCKYSLVKEKDVFFEELKVLINYFKKFSGFVIIIPFFDNNFLENEKDLEIVYKEISTLDSFLKEYNLFFSLEIDMAAKKLLGVYSRSGHNVDNIGFCYDLGNRYSQAVDLGEEIKLFGNRLNHVHVKYKENGENKRIIKHNSAYMDGFRSLGRINYKGLFILETCILPNPLKEARENLSTLRKYLELK